MSRCLVFYSCSFIFLPLTYRLSKLPERTLAKSISEVVLGSVVENGTQAFRSRRGKARP